jgi:hypothetical protein
MNKDRIKGAGEQAKGTVKEAAGKVTGDVKLEAEGKPDRQLVTRRAQSATLRIRFAANNPMQ